MSDFCAHVKIASRIVSQAYNIDGYVLVCCQLQSNTSAIGSRDFSRHLTNGGSYTKSSRPPLFPSFTLPCLCGRDDRELIFKLPFPPIGWLGSRVVSMLDSGAVGPGFKSQPRRCRVTVLGKLFTTIVPLFTKQRN